MQFWPWRTMVVAGVVIALIYAVLRSDPEVSSSSQATPEQLVERLANPREPVRRAAASQLVNRGVPAVPALLNAIESADNDHLNEIFLVLEDFYLSSDESVYDSVELALEDLAHHSRGNISRQAQRLLQLNYTRRHSRAYARIEAAGGRIGTAYPQQKPDDGSSAELVFLDAGWHGGEAELNLLRYLRYLSSVHVSQDAHLTEQNLDQLREMLPFVMIRLEHQPCLGIECFRNSTDVRVVRVSPYSPAERAGLQMRDWIVEIDGQPAGSTLNFFDKLNSYAPGDRLELKVRRGGQQLSLTVELGDDFATGRCRCQGPDALETADESEPRYSSGGRLLHPTDRLLGPSPRSSVNLH